MSKKFILLNISMILILIIAVTFFLFVPKESIFPEKEKEVIKVSEGDSSSLEKKTSIAVKIEDVERNEIPEKETSASEYANLERIIDRLIQATNPEEE